MKIKNYLPQILTVTGLLALWQVVYSLGVFPALLFPSIPQILTAFWQGLAQEQMGLSILYSLWYILRGLLLGIALSVVFSAISMSFRPAHKIYYMFISLFDPLPGIALLPLAILWFGTGDATIIFIILHSVIWPLSRSILDGFTTVPVIYVESGRNFGLRGLRLVRDVYFMAALPSLISGVKTGWARAWRALISAEMIFGVTGSIGGIGWHIFTSRYKMDTPAVFAALIAIILIGLLVEYALFGAIEKRTVRKWGLVR